MKRCVATEDRGGTPTEDRAPPTVHRERSRADRESVTDDPFAPAGGADALQEDAVQRLSTRLAPACIFSNMSVVSYVRLRCALEEGLDRYGRWIGAPEVAPRRLVREREAIDLATDGDEWLGLAVFVYASGEWTVIEELSGGLSERPVESWLELAAGGDLVYAGCNDAIAYAQLIVIERGRLVREFLQDEDDPGQNVNVGRLPEESGKRMETWIDGARWVEEDELRLTRPDEGWLWIHRADFGGSAE